MDPPYWRTNERRKERWETFVDKQLCKLADRSRVAGYHHTLEVELRLAGVGGSYGRRLDSPKFLPGFKEKGVVTPMWCQW